jgi:Lrp/AsnC family transcriptional regulator for asnA, asnC and gidA
MIGIRVEASRLIEVAEEIASFAETDYVVVTAGSYDILVEAVAEDNDALLEFLSGRLRKIPGVRETETFVYLRLMKQNYQWGTR